MTSFESIKSNIGKSDTVGDPNDQSEIVNRKIARATADKPSLASMLKVSASKIRKKKRGNT